MSALPNRLERTERRANERVKLDLFGRCLLPNGVEVPCQSIDVSPGDLAVTAMAAPALGERVIFYMDELGRLEGDCVRLFEGGFAVVLEASARRREKLLGQIEWLQEHHAFGIEDARQFKRFVPREQNSHLRMEDGRRYPVRIIDISLSGAAVALDVRPAIGAPVSLAGLQGSVVRHFSGGIALEFERPRSPQELDAVAS